MNDKGSFLGREGMEGNEQFISMERSTAGKDPFVLIEAARALSRSPVQGRQREQRPV